MVPARTWRACSGNGAHRMVKIEEADGSSTGKKSTTSMEVFGLEVGEELASMATQTWAEGVWIGQWCTEQREAWLSQVFDVQTWRQVRGPAGAVMCETRDLGIKWPQWRTLIF